MTRTLAEQDYVARLMDHSLTETTKRFTQRLYHELLKYDRQIKEVEIELVTLLKHNTDYYCLKDFKKNS